MLRAPDRMRLSSKLFQPGGDLRVIEKAREVHNAAKRAGLLPPLQPTPLPDAPLTAPTDTESVKSQEPMGPAAVPCAEATGQPSTWGAWDGQGTTPPDEPQGPWPGAPTSLSEILGLLTPAPLPHQATEEPPQAGKACSSGRWEGAAAENPLEAHSPQEDSGPGQSPGGGGQAFWQPPLSSSSTARSPAFHRRPPRPRRCWSPGGAEGAQLQRHTPPAATAWPGPQTPHQLPSHAVMEVLPPHDAVLQVTQMGDN